MELRAFGVKAYRFLALTIKRKRIMYQYNRNTGEIREDGQHIATTSDSATYEQGQLIAAAPELLEALKSILDRLGKYPMSDEELAEHCRNAIAKAEGKESHV